MINLLGDDDVPKFIPSGRRAPKEEDNFSALQDLGRKTNSVDFEDSPYADRKPKMSEEQLEEIERRLN